jgi:membrane dipeptidase
MDRDGIAALHRSSIVIDGHCDTIFQAMEEKRHFTEPAPPGTPAGDVDVPRLLQGGVTAQFMALCVNDEHHGAAQALIGLDSFLSAYNRCPDMLLATKAEHIQAAKATGKVAMLLALESSDALEGEIACLRQFYRLGIRAMSLTHNPRNRAADGVAEVVDGRRGGGLSAFGRELVQEMNRLGMIVDIAHLAPAGVEEVFALARGPVIASHANAYALRPHPRNLSDEQLRSLARAGGVVGVTCAARFLADGLTTLDMLLDHIEHIIKVAGVEHVGLGTDFDGFIGPRPIGLEDIGRLPNLTAGLADRGHSADDIRAILGGNYLRVIERICG